MKFLDRVRRALERKSPWVAALLNLMPGLGYLYAGRKKLVGLSLVTAVWTWVTFGGMVQTGSEISPLFFYWAAVGAPLFVCLALARDAYIETEKGNKEE